MRTSTLILILAGVAITGGVGYVMFGNRRGLGATGAGNTGSDRHAGGGSASADWGTQAASLLGGAASLVGAWKGAPKQPHHEGWGVEGVDWVYAK